MKILFIWKIYTPISNLTYIPHATNTMVHRNVVVVDSMRWKVYGKAVVLYNKY